MQAIRKLLELVMRCNKCVSAINLNIILLDAECLRYNKNIKD